MRSDPAGISSSSEHETKDEETANMQSEYNRNFFIVLNLLIEFVIVRFIVCLAAWLLRHWLNLVMLHPKMPASHTDK